MKKLIETYFSCGGDNSQAEVVLGHLEEGNEESALQAVRVWEGQKGLYRIDRECIRRLDCALCTDDPLMRFTYLRTGRKNLESFGYSKRLIDALKGQDKN